MFRTVTFSCVSVLTIKDFTRRHGIYSFTWSELIEKEKLKSASVANTIGRNGALTPANSVAIDPNERAALILLRWDTVKPLSLETVVSNTCDTTQFSGEAS